MADGSHRWSGGSTNGPAATPGHTGALYGPGASYASGTPQPVPAGPPVSARPAANGGPIGATNAAPIGASNGASPWWSGSADDPWRDPSAPSAIVVSAPPGAGVTPPVFDTPARSVTLSKVLLISILSALLAGGLGGALGYFAAIRGGVSAGTVLGAGPGGTAPLTQRAPTSLAGIVKAILPSVVTIRVDGANASAIGTGFIVSADGYVITNDHVATSVDGQPTAIFSDGTTAHAVLVGHDPESDIAVLKVDRTGLPAVTFGDSDQVAVGDPVLAVGAPFDLPNTVTYGIVSALHRPLEVSDSGSTRYYAAIQTDAAVNHGNSGGPLVDGAGRVIGVDSVIKSVGSNDQDSGNIGLAFAIPINHAKRVAEQIISGGKVTRTVIGATIDQQYENKDGGVLLRGVSAGGPAEAAGLKVNDVVLTVGGAPLAAPGDLTALIRAYAPGELVTLTYRRGNSVKTAEVKVAADPG